MLQKYRKNFGDKLEFLLEFVAVASIIFLISLYSQNYYELFLRKIVSSYYSYFKNIFALQPPQRVYSDILLLQEVSFFALILVVPKIPLKRKIKFLVIGTLVFFTSDILFTILEVSFQNSYVWTLLAADFLKLALPISLWFIFSYNYFLQTISEKS
jgi:hypothetical protein